VALLFILDKLALMAGFVGWNGSVSLNLHLFHKYDLNLVVISTKIKIELP